MAPRRGRTLEGWLRRASALALLLSVLPVAALAQAPASASPETQGARPVRVAFPARGVDPDRRLDFAAELLQLCLAESPEGYRVALTPALIGARARDAALRGEADVVMLPNTTADAGGLVPIALPLRRGLLGVRLLLARKERAAALMDVPSLEALKSGYTLGYGSDWVDADAMQRLGFRMAFVDRYPALFDALRAGRFDYLSRGVNELAIERREQRLAGGDLVVVPGIALFYPLDDYFWVRPGDVALAGAIERGFRAALTDGRYAALFERHFQQAMLAVRIHERSVIHVVGYPVPAGTPLEDFDILQLTSSRGTLVFPDDPPR